MADNGKARNMRVQMFKKGITVFLMFVVCILSISGCGNKNLDIKIDKTISDKTIEYKLFAHNLNVYAESDRILKSIEDKFNIKISLEGAPENGWMEKLCLLINANDAPNAFNFIPNDYTYSSSYYNFVKKGMILPISDLLSEKDTPNINKLLNCDLYKNLTIDGKYYFVPSPTYPTNHVMYVRKDWMDKLGISEPTTLDQFTSMLKAFTENDPDGNGQKDTYGLSASKVFEWLNNFKATFNVKPGWSKDAGGKWQLDAFTPEYGNFLKWMGDIYTKGYMKSEFYLYDDTEAENDFINGKAGCYITNGDLKVGGMVSKLAKVNKTAVIDTLAMPDGSGKGGYVGTGSWWGGWSISYDAPEPFRLVKLLDYLHSPEGQMTRLYGIENIHYTIDAGGSLVPNFTERKNEGDKKFPAGDDGKARSIYSFGAYFGSGYTINGTSLKIKTFSSVYTEPEKTQRAWDQTNKNIVYQFPATGMELPSEFSKLSMKVNDSVNIYSVRIIAGSIDFDAGITKMKEEINAAGYSRMQDLLVENIKK